MTNLNKLFTTSVSKLILVFFCCFAFIPSFAQILRVGQRVDIIVDSVLYADSQVVAAVNQYASAVHDFYGIEINTYAFKPAAYGSTAQELKSEIKKSWENSDRGHLEGVILMGDLPRPMMEYPQWNNDGFRYQRWVTDYYYMDMDGDWLDTASGWQYNAGGKIKDTLLKSPQFNINSRAPFVGAPADSFSIRFEGFVKASQTGLCSLKVVSDNHRRIFVGDTAVIDAWIDDYDKPYYGAVELKAGKVYPVKIEYAESYGGANFALYKKYESETEWTSVHDSVWFLDEECKNNGIKATYFANMFLQDSLDHAGEKAGWKSGVPNGVFDGHYSKKGAVSDSFEIWVSRVDPNTATLYGTPKTLLLQWLKKATQEHQGKNHSNKSGFFITEDADTTSASEKKFLNGLRYIYPDENPEVMKVNGKTYVETIAGDYDWITYVGHGNELGLANGFYVSQLKYPYAVKARVFHFASCSPLYNYDYVGNHYSISVGSAHVFGTTGGGLAAVGATKTSGDNQLDDFMYYAARDSLLGEAYLSWINQRIKRNRYPGNGIYDWFYVESLVGDPFVSMSTDKVSAVVRKNLPAGERHFIEKQNFDVKGRSRMRNTTPFYYIIR